LNKKEKLIFRRKKKEKKIYYTNFFSFLVAHWLCGMRLQKMIIICTAAKFYTHTHT